MAGAKQGGAETFFSDLVSALSKTDIEQKIVVRSESAITNILRTNGLDVIEFPFRGRFDFITKQKLLNEIRESSYCPDLDESGYLSLSFREPRACRLAWRIL